MGHSPAPAQHGLPASPSHASAGSDRKPSGSAAKLLSARRMSSSWRHCTISSGSAASWLFESMHFLRPASLPIDFGSAVSLLSVRMSHSTDGASASSGMCVSWFDLNDIM